jgi:glycosyltransferase involved in cell wall biosynthesis
VAQAVRVLHVLTCDAIGGTETMVSLLAAAHQGSEVVAEVATLAPPGPIAEQLRAAGVPVRSLGGAGRAATLRRLGALMRAGRYDVVCAYGVKGTAAVRVLVPLLSPRSRVVNGVRGLFVADAEDRRSARARLLLLAELLGSPLVDAYDANSRGALDLLAGSGIPRRKLHYIPNGVDVARWPAARTPHDPPVVLCVARFIGLKRQIDLVEAATLLRARAVPFRLVFVGDGPERPVVEQRAAVLGLGDQARFDGILRGEALRAAYAGADVFCLCSASEGMPGSVMEAMASSLPVVGTRVNGIRDLVAHERTGLLVEPRDPAGLAAALERLLRDATLRETWGSAGRERVELEFSLDAMVRRKAELFTDLTRQCGS